MDRPPFSHPLWIVYSSGTTGMPKAMVHGHGGIVLTHLKTLALQQDVRWGDRMLFLGGTGWIVWNLQLDALLTGAASGGIDVLINNAGSSGPTASVEQMDPDAWESVLRVNLTGTFNVTRHSIPHLKRSPAGVVLARLPARRQDGLADLRSHQ